MKKGKKKPDFGKTWGAMKKKDANASFVETGNGLYVIDIDAKKIPKKYKKWIKSLGSPTVETKRGYHFYIKSKAPMTNHQNIFNDDKFKVDIRGEGGLVFNEYWGKEKDISYITTGKPIKDKNFKIFKTLPKSVREPNAKKTNTESRADIGKVDLKEAKAMLKKLDPKDYQDRDAWLAIMASFFHGTGSKGYETARKWSSRDKDSFDSDAFDNIWAQFENGKYGEDISYGSLVHAVVGDKVEECFANEKKLTPKEKKKKKKAEKKQRTKDKKDFDPLNAGGQLDDAMLKERKNQKVLFDSVIVERMHTFIYGAAGSNKTTVISWIACDILQRHAGKIVHFWSFDAADNHETAMYNYGKDRKVSDRFHIYTNKTSEDYQTHYEKAVEYESDLSSLIIILDTWKFISKDVNSKGANKEAMHFIKKLQSLGATIVSLGHTNKDGIKNSGTAEIEQDSDAVLRIDRKADEFSREVTLTIEAAGRVRFSCTGVSFKSTPKGKDYKYLYTALTSMTKSEFISLSEEVEDKREETPKTSAKDKRIVDEIGRIIDELNDGKNTKAFQSLIIHEAKRQEKITEVKTTALLREFAKDKWLFSQKKNKGGKKEKCYIST